jgi:hypothetical protein
VFEFKNLNDDCLSSNMEARGVAEMPLENNTPHARRDVKKLEIAMSAKRCE